MPRVQAAVRRSHRPGPRSAADRSLFPRETELLCGPDGVARLVTDADVDVVVSAVVGAAGLAGTWAALEAGKTVALANKETLVVAGPLVMELAATRGGELLPVDSEHSAIFQALAGPAGGARSARVVLTASGGPFRGKTGRELDRRHARAGPEAPDLADGAEDHDRLGHADEQGAGGDRGPLAVRPARRSRSR